MTLSVSSGPLLSLKVRAEGFPSYNSRSSSEIKESEMGKLILKLIWNCEELLKAKKYF